MTTEECTDGTLNGWPCSVSITGDPTTGYDVTAAPYTDKDDNSAPDEIRELIESIDGSFKTKKPCRNLAIVAGFIPSKEWGWMDNS